MEERRRHTTIRQLELLVEFLQDHQDLALGKVRSKEARAVAARLWRECSLILNAEGPARTAKEWAKVWNDQKCRVRAKLITINANQQATGGGPSNAATLTPLENAIANILGRDGQALYLMLGKIHLPHKILQINNADLGNIEGQPEQDSAVASPAPSVTTARSPSSSQNERNRTRRVRQKALRTAVRQSTIQIPPAQSNRTALDESRSMVLKIENMRAEAALLHAQAMKSFADGFKQLAGSVDRLTQVYSQNNTRASERQEE